MLLLVLSFTAIIPGSLSAQENKEQKPELTEVQKLKAENFKLKFELAQTKITLQDREKRLVEIELNDEQNKLVKEYREQLKADEKAEFDWSSLSFKPLTVPDKK